jgi:exopolyphosphatase / guanosine-5'-triphosphate,3'-diphosphate pyrophosphatase
MKVLGSQKLKVPFLSGIINIYSHSLELEIFQMTKEGKETLELLDQNINLNTDIFRRGAVSLKKISLICDIMQEFAHKLREYDVKYYRALLACSLREASNCDILINHVKTSSGIDIELISPTEEIRLLFLHIREQICESYNFLQINTLSFALGANALLLMISERGKLKLCESIPLNLISSFDKHGNSKIKPHKFLDLLKALNIQEKLHAKSSQYFLIGADKNTRSLVNIDKKYNNSDFIEFTSSKLSVFLKKISKLSTWQIMDRYKISEQEVAKLLFQKHIIKALLKLFKCKKTLFPPFSIHNALAADMTRNKSKLFENDVIYVAESIGEKYKYDAAHVENVTVNCLKIFDKLHRKYDLNKRSRHLLHLAAKLHDIGRFIDLEQYRKHSYYLIRNAQLPGINEKEQLIIATVASCQRKRIQRKHPKYAILSRDEKTIIDKLTSILLIGDMLDNFNPNDSKKLIIRLNKTNLTVKIPNYSEELIEQADVSADSKLFHETFGLEMKLCGAPGNYEI